MTLRFDHSHQKKTVEAALRAGRVNEAIVVARALAANNAAESWKHALLSRCLLAAGNIEEAATVAEHVLIATDSDAKAFSDAGCVLSISGQHQLSLTMFERAAALEPERAAHHFNLAMEQRFLGRLEEAELSCDRTIALAPQENEAWLIRSELKKQTTENNHVAALIAQLREPQTDPQGQSQLLYTLAKELDDLGEYDRAFEAMTQGAHIRRRAINYDVANDEAIMAAIMDNFSREIITQPSTGCSSASPIFIVGLPRSGTTLAERLIGQHPAVHAAGELMAFTQAMAAMLRASGFSSGGEPKAMVQATLKCSFSELGEAYLRFARPFASDTPHFIDKLPFNYLYCGLIHLALPNARIIRLRRDPTDVCLAMYKTYFKEAYPFSYDFNELARYFASYTQLMDHWHRVQPGTILDVNYEDLVADPETQVRRMLSHCHLEWDPACDPSRNTTQAVTTASAAQVRAPIYQTSVGKWRRYEQQLHPLQQQLKELQMIQ